MLWFSQHIISLWIHTSICNYKTHHFSMIRFIIRCFNYCYSSAVESNFHGTVSFIVFGKLHCFGTVDIFVISRPKWLKFGVQAHFFKMFGHTKFQLSISCTFKVMKLLVEITKKSNSNFLHKWAYHSSSVDFSAKVHSWGHLVQTQKKALRHSNYINTL